MKYLLLLLIVTLFGCQQQSTPWKNLSWLNKAETSISFIDKDAKGDIVLDYYDYVTKEEQSFRISFNLKESATVNLSLFRPELIDLTYGDQSFSIYVIPGKEIKLEVGDEIKPIENNAQMYTSLLRIGTLEKSDSTDLKTISPKWLNAYLNDALQMKTLQEEYQKKGYSRNMGDPSAIVSKEDKRKAEELLKDFKSGIYQRHYSLLLNFKTSYESLESMTSTDAFWKYTKGKKLLDFLNDSIEDKKLKNNFLAIHLEGMIRKRKQFPKRDEVISYGMSLLPKEYAEKLEAIDQSYRDDEVKKQSIQALFNKEVVGLNGPSVPELSSNKNKLLKFWFVGCYPCTLQIPHEKELLESNKNIELISLCYKSDEDRWKKYINDKYGEEGKHYNISNIGKEYNKLFNLKSAPRYVLLDEDNNVLEWNAAMPSYGVYAD